MRERREVRHSARCNDTGRAPDEGESATQITNEMRLTRERGRAVVAKHSIAEFWQWFRSVCGHFGDSFQNRKLIDELDSRVARLGQFSWELGPGVHDSHNSALVLTPCGDPDLLRETREVIEAAPECPGWEFYPAKPPKNWQRKFVLQNDDGSTVDVDASSARYVLLRYPDGVFDVLLADHELAALPESLRETAVEVLLDGELGEERRMMSIHSVDVVGEFEEEMQRRSSSIETLAAHVRSFVR